MNGVSVVIPAYNEEGAVGEGVREVIEIMDASDHEYELIVVDDGSVDKTGELAKAAGAQVYTMPENRGYGAALKAGISRAKYDVIVITDADGTYPAESIPTLLGELGEYDMVVGARIGVSAVDWSVDAGPVGRRR